MSSNDSNNPSFVEKIGNKLGLTEKEEEYVLCYLSSLRYLLFLVAHKHQEENKHPSNPPHQTQGARESTKVSRKIPTKRITQLICRRRMEPFNLVLVVYCAYNRNLKQDLFAEEWGLG